MIVRRRHMGVLVVACSQVGQRTVAVVDIPLNMKVAIDSDGSIVA